MQCRKLRTAKLLRRVSWAKHLWLLIKEKMIETGINSSNREKLKSPFLTQTHMTHQVSHIDTRTHTKMAGSIAALT